MKLPDPELDRFWTAVANVEPNPLQKPGHYKSSKASARELFEQ